MTFEESVRAWHRAGLNADYFAWDPSVYETLANQVSMAQQDPTLKLCIRPGLTDGGTATFWTYLLDRDGHVIADAGCGPGNDSRPCPPVCE